MKFQLKTLSLPLSIGLFAVLGACTAVNSSTPSTETSSDDAVELQETTENSELENSGFETTEEMETTEEEIESTEDSVSGMEETMPSEMEASEEMETTEDPTSGLEATEETEPDDIESDSSSVEELEESEVILPEDVDNESDDVNSELEPVR